MNLDKLLDEINELSNGRKVELVAVSKYVSSKEIKKLFDNGQMSFGENRVQDLVKKSDELKELMLKYSLSKNSYNSYKELYQVFKR